MRAEYDEVVELSWTYTTDDPIARLELCFLYLFFDGMGAECSTVDSDVNPLALSLDSLDASFLYRVPVTAWLRAANEDGETSEAALDVRDLSDAYMWARIETNFLHYPYLGAPVPADVQDLPASWVSRVDFSQFVAFEDVNGDGRIEDLIPLMPGREFVHEFRGDTWDGFERPDGTFDLRSGPQFPFLVGQSDVLVYGGAIAVYGEEVPVKHGAQDGFFRRAPELYFDEIFLLAAYERNVDAIPIVARDVAVGNLTQGLVLKANDWYRDTLLAPEADLGNPNAPTIFPPPIGPGHWIGAYVKNAVAGHTITPQSGDLIWPRARVTDLQYAMPLVGDDALQGGECLFEPLSGTTGTPTCFEP